MKFENMKTIQIPVALHSMLKIYASKNRISITQALCDIIKKFLGLLSILIIFNSCALLTLPPSQMTAINSLDGMDCTYNSKERIEVIKMFIARDSYKPTVSKKTDLWILTNMPVECKGKKKLPIIPGSPIVENIQKFL